MEVRFTIRTALIGLTIGAVFSLVLAYAVRGGEWAVGIVAGVASLFAVFLAHALLFGVVRLFGLILSPPAVQQAPDPTPADQRGPIE